MGIGEQLRQQLAAKALKRQLDRAGQQEVERTTPTITSPAATTASGLADLARFESLPAYQQMQVMQEMRSRLSIESPFFRVHQGHAGDTTVIDGRRYINFASYNYLGSSGDPEISAYAKAAIDQYGTSASASRMVAGERPIQRELEQALAANYEVDDALAMVSGHATNVTVIGYLFGPNDLIVHDALAHNSIVQGAQLSGAKRLSFAHNDWAALDELLTRVRGDYRRVLIAIEGLYSMDGDHPDLPRFIEIKQRHAAFLLVDEAHALGVLGATGRGSAEYFGIAGREVDIWMGTMSKTLGGCGGYIAGSHALVDLLRHFAPGFLYSVGLSPPLAAAALASLRRMQAEPQRVAQLRERGHYFLQQARAAGLDTGTSAGYAVIPVITGSSLTAAQWSNALFEEGINTQPIFYPAVEEKAARLRFFICCTHTVEQIDTTIAALARLNGQR